MQVKPEHIEAERAIRNALRESIHPALLFSAGKESSLLLGMLERLGDEARRVPLLCFFDEWPPEPERFRFLEETFRSHSRVLINFWPLYRFLVPTREGFDLVNAYDLNGKALPVLTSAVDDGSNTLPCALDWIRLPRKDCPDFCFDLLICGGRREDTHQWIGNPYRQQTIPISNSKLFLPLLEWTEGEVWEAIEMLDIPYDRVRYDEKAGGHLDEMKMCARCLGGRTDAYFCSRLGSVITLNGAAGGSVSREAACDIGG